MNLNQASMGVQSTDCSRYVSTVVYSGTNSTQGDIIVTSSSDTGLSAAATKTMILRGDWQHCYRHCCLTCWYRQLRHRHPQEAYHSSCKDLIG